ncbi:BZ3500_MvSof-1268-A1-R1_Chr9g10853 [Microbotryum saponariae]|uniref:BZ3500_MvSof-1268-A1-R1_Chr9g10853 protein n=1 Tax=Microbotryum saponariae TaxID=289078 RepID=A0A2X0L5L8_9BASI|nr:BZ3501_MvSof-1269-A2-R1_Chr9g10601 [Microbotryum saponariae]SDA00809.1 BZ3500_MvSof-1268-A1-R1_Chr9g10853 [Microbotryum saponariae]
MSTSSDDHGPGTSPGNASQLPKSGKDEAILLVRCLPTNHRRSNQKAKTEKHYVNESSCARRKLVHGVQVPS